MTAKKRWRTRNLKKLALESDLQGEEAKLLCKLIFCLEYRERSRQNGENGKNDKIFGVEESLGINYRARWGEEPPPPPQYRQLPPVWVPHSNTFKAALGPQLFIALENLYPILGDFNASRFPKIFPLKLISSSSKIWRNEVTWSSHSHKWTFRIVLFGFLLYKKYSGLVLEPLVTQFPQAQFYKT